MIQNLKPWVFRSIFQERTEDNTQSLSLGEDLDDLNEWRTGQYGWVTKGGKPYEQSLYSVILPDIV